MQRSVMQRSHGKPVLCYADGYREVTFDPKKIQWLLRDTDALVSFSTLSNNFSKKKVKNSSSVAYLYL